MYVFIVFDKSEIKFRLIVTQKFRGRVITGHIGLYCYFLEFLMNLFTLPDFVYVEVYGIQFLSLVVVITIIK